MNADGHRFLFSLTAISLHALTVASKACPFCETQQGQEVRGSIFGSDFWPALGALAAPFLVLTAGLVWYSRSGSNSR